MRPLSAIVVIACIAACNACGGDGGTASVPRRTAYPRICAPDTLYIKAPDAPVGIDINADASASVEHRPDGSVWLTAAYPAFRAKILCTFTPVDESTVQSVVDNRTERISLNGGGQGAILEELHSAGGYYANIVRGENASATPVQFIAVKKEHPRWVVSGAAYFPENTPSMAADSLEPIVNRIYTDTRRMMLSLTDL